MLQPNNTWTVLGAQNSQTTVSKVTLFNDGQGIDGEASVIGLGTFDFINDQGYVARYQLARFTMQGWMPFGPTINGQVLDIEGMNTPDGPRLAIGGDFTSVGDQSVNGFAVFEPSTSACVGDFNCDGGITTADLSEFLTAYEQGFIQADVDQSGGIDGGDVAVFFAVFEAGGCE